MYFEFLAMKLFRPILFISLFFCIVFNTLAQEQGYPQKLVRIVVPNGAGGPTDLIARIMAQKLSESMGQTFIIENKLGAGGVVGTEAVARAQPDGYTLLFSASGAMVISPHLNKKLPYNGYMDFSPIANAASSPMLLVVGSNTGIQSLNDLIQQAKLKPGQFNYSTAGMGTPPHLAAELLKSISGIDVVHVPYKDVPQADGALMSGEVTFMFSQPKIASMARTGKLKVLGITTPKRSSLLPDVPTLSESGVSGFDVVPWYGLFAPLKTPDEIVQRLNLEVQKLQNNKDYVERMKALGFEIPPTHSPSDFNQFLVREYAKWQKVIAQAAIKVE
jgi:tripartite-type tricarboxylate transporter receptor subunit TctC